MQIEVIELDNHLWLETLQKLRHDVYHLPEYFLLESVNTQMIPQAILITDKEKIFFAPYLLRKCSELIYDIAKDVEIIDITSPYGYPGILLSEAAINAPDFPNLAMSYFKEILRNQGVCSAFIRLHPILNENFDKIFKTDIPIVIGETVSVDLRILESQIWSSTRSGHKSTINKCKRIGMVAKMVSVGEYTDQFTNIYQETMKRVEATERYYKFDVEYYKQMYKLLGDKLHMCIVNYEDEVACAGLYTECCGIVQSTLGGTRDKFVYLSPSSLETDYARYWAKERGNDFLHLGGGVGASKDSVYSFKAGFSKLRHSFMTLQLIIDKDKYFDLLNLRAKILDVSTQELLDTNFFPAYLANVS